MMFGWRSIQGPRYFDAGRIFTHPYPSPYDSPQAEKAVAFNWWNVNPATRQIAVVGGMFEKLGELGWLGKVLAEL